MKKIKKTNTFNEVKAYKDETTSCTCNCTCPKIQRIPSSTSGANISSNNGV